MFLGNGGHLSPHKPLCADTGGTDKMEMRNVWSGLFTMDICNFALSTH